MSMNFQKSITRELDVIKNRVRDLIGNAHWGEDGRFKEAVLKNIIRKFLPNNLSIGTGFISNNNGHISKQLDIIIYDNTYPLLFSEGDFIIITIHNVKAVIEVKSNITHTTLKNVLQQFDDSFSNINIENRNIFLGIFSFEFKVKNEQEELVNADINSRRIDVAILNSRHLVNHISLGTDYFIRKWPHESAQDLNPRVDCTNDFYNLYSIENLSFSYFISNLLDNVCGGLGDREWFLFPIEGTKEVNRLRSVCIGQLNANP